MVRSVLDCARVPTHTAVEGVDGLVQSMGSYLSKMTARDLTRMGVEIHLQAMVTDMNVPLRVF